MRTSGPPLCLGLLLGALLTPVTAGAQERGEAEGQALFDAAVIAFDDARFGDALEYFERALQASGRAELHYNVGLCLTYLDRDAEAIAAFERYLAAFPDADNRQNVEARIRHLRESDDGPRGQDASIALLVVGAVLAVSGGAVLAVGAGWTQSLNDTPSGTRPYSEAQADADVAAGLQIGGGIGLGVGAAVAVVGLLLLATGGASSTDQASWSGRWRF